MTGNKGYPQKAVAIAEKEGATEAIALLTEGVDYQIRFSNSNIDISKQWDHSLLEVFVAVGRKVTEVDIQHPTAAKIRNFISRAVKFVAGMPENELYHGIETKKHTHPNIKGIFDKQIEGFYQRAPELVNAAIQSSLQSGAKRSSGVLYFGTENKKLLNSHGIQGSYISSHYRFTIRSFVDYESSGQHVVVGRDLTDVEEKFIKAGTESGKIAKMAVNGKQGKAGKYDLIMTPTVAANVLGQITDRANPIMILLGMSPLKEKMGKEIGPDNLNVVDNSTVGEGLGSRPFDVEGTPSNQTPIIKDGVLVGLIHNTSTGKIMRTESTGNSSFVNFGVGSKLLAPAPTNMIYQPGDHSPEEIIEESKKPSIYVTSNWYTRYTNMLEGEFSTIPRDGMFLIKDGEIQKPIRKLRLADNLLDMTKRIEAIGKDVQQIHWWEVNTPTFVPTIKVSNCNFTAATK